MAADIPESCFNNSVSCPASTPTRPCLKSSPHEPSKISPSAARRLVCEKSVREALSKIKRGPDGHLLWLTSLGLFCFPPLVHRKLFLALKSWWTAYEPFEVPSDPHTLVFQYLFNQRLADSSDLLDKFQAYALAACVVWTLICFLDISRAGVSSHEDLDD